MSFLKRYQFYGGVILVFVASFLFWSEVYATRCVLPPRMYVAVCEKGICREGFEVQYKYTYTCGGKQPVINEYPEHLQRVFTFVAEQANEGGILDGIYQIDAESYCIPSPEYIVINLEKANIEDKTRWRLGCIETGAATLAKITSDTSGVVFDTYKREWEDRVEKAQRDIFVMNWGGVIAILFFVLFVVGWPWLRFWRKPLERQKLFHWLLIAIPFQIFLAFLSFVFLTSGVPPFWAITMLIGSAFLLLATLGEILYTIFRGIKRSKA